MFRLSRHKPDRSSGQRIEFKLSNFQAFQVPKGWDKLFLSVVSVDTGKTIAKSGKAAVHGGTCQWTETFSEYIWVYQDDVSKEFEECLYKIIVATGSARSGILGEVIINLTDYMGSRDPDPLSLPLKRCNHGSILQIKIQCYPPKTKSRDRKSQKEATSHREDLHTNYEDIDSKSDGSDNMINKSASSSNSHLGITSYPDELGNREASLSASGSHRSSDSGESSIGRTNFSPVNSLNGGAYMGRHDSAGSHISAASGAGPGDDFCRSNHSSFNSRASGSIHANQWQEITSQTSIHGVAPSSLRPSDSSKDLLEAAEETIEELQDEAKMWERHSRKLKLDLEMLKKENSDKSKHQADLEMKLSAACTERDSLKQEIEKLKSSLEELMEKQTVNGTTKIDEMISVQDELEDEVKFQKETNADLTLQLKKTQEANIELVSILQELEETVEKQSLEIANLSQNSHVDEPEENMRSQALLDIEAEWERKLIAKDKEIIKLEEKISDIFNAKHRSELVCDGGDPNLIKEIDALKAKVQELETDCLELTEENLELIFKMKESRKGTKEGKTSLDSTFNESKSGISPNKSELEIGLPKSQINHLEQELRKTEMLDEGLTAPSKIQIKSLEEKCTDLELELQHFKDQACYLSKELQKSQAEVKEKIQEFTELQQRLETLQDIDLGCIGTGNERKLEDSGTFSISETSRILFEMNEQLHIAFTHVRNLRYDGESDVTATCVNNNDFVKSSSRDAITQNEQAEAMLSSFIELNNLLRASVIHFKSLYQDLKDRLFLKEKEIDVLEHSNKDLEDLISNIQREKDQLEENLAVALQESNISSTCLGDIRHDLMSLTSNLESQVSTNKMLERKSLELENGKQVLELHISELEEENVQLSERISGLDAQLRYLTNDKESNRLELEDSRSVVLDLKNEITKQQSEGELQRIELKQKLQESQKELSEVQEESEYLKRSHSKLQATVESLIEECNSLQKLNGVLRRQKFELHERLMHLEVELNESQKKNIVFCEKVEFLDVKLSSLQKDITSKEKSLISQLESIFQEHKEHDEKISQAHVTLNRMESTKSIEVENLERQITHLTSQLSSTHDERERIASEAVNEAFNLQLDKSKLESNLQEANAKVKLYETEMHSLRQESGNKVQGLVDLLNASKQSEEMLLADIVRMQRLMESVKTSEETFKRMTNELELKLKASDYEKQEIMEEISSLKVQLQKIALLQDELLTLKSSLDEAKFEKGKLKESLESISEECKELKAERVSLMEKISNMQKALHNGEDDRRSRITLEEKLLRLEGDLTAREASYAHEAELKNELNRIKRTNNEYQRKIHCLEEEKDEFLRKAQVLEKELSRKNENKHAEKISSKTGIEIHTSEPHDTEQSQDFRMHMQHIDLNQHEGVDGSKLEDGMESPQIGKEDLESRIHILENELALALEANNKYRVQLKSSPLENQNGGSDITKETPSENRKRSNNTSRTAASLEVELKEMQERYLHMSLQYAEVEAQREELVMQLKSVKKGGWFS